MYKEQIDNYIDSKKEDIIRDITKLISFRSTASEPAEITASLDYVIARAEEMGFKTTTTKEHDVAIIEMGEGDETIGVLAHVDVVEIGDPEKWTHPPFECTEENGYLMGRGTTDDKGPVIMSLYAMKAIKDLQIPLTKRIQFIVGTSEEVYWTDMDHFIEQFPCPDCGFSPDGDFPIYNAEKGYADVVLTFAEPHIDIIESIASGDSPNTIPSKATIKLAGEGEQVFEGVSSHSSIPEDAKNAIDMLCQALANREEFVFPRFINEVTKADYYAPALGLPEPSTTVPTVMRKTDVGVSINFNLRPKVGVTEADVIAGFGKYAEEYGYTVSITEFEPGMEVDESIAHLQTMKSVAESYGQDSRFLTAPGTSYAKAMPNFVSWGPTFPDEPSTAHMEDEHLSISRMMLATKMYTSYLAEYGTL